MSVLDQDLERAEAAARDLAGAPVEVNRLAAGGRNSRIWRVKSGGRDFALKEYPSRRDDPRNRLATEVGALQLMARHGIVTVPRVVGADRARGYVLMSFIEGGPVGVVGDTDIDAAVAFLAAIHGLRGTPEALSQPFAAEACLSGAEVERQIAARLERLRQDAPGEAALMAFLDGAVTPEFARLCAAAVAGMAAAGLDFSAELPQVWRSLVPADFGFHNSLRRGDGSLMFVDFEYFGWDDPVKLVADILLNPGHTLARPQRARFRQAARQLYGRASGFEARLGAYLPLFGVRWVLIILNEFLPERWRRRVLAGHAGDWADAKAKQLAFAREFLATLPQKVEG